MSKTREIKNVEMKTATIAASAIINKMTAAARTVSATINGILR